MAQPYAFDSEGMQQEQKYVRDGALTQIGGIIRVDVGTAGLVPGGDSSGWIQVPLCNGITLHVNIAYPQGGGAPVMVTSSTTARVFIQFNREDSPWILFSYIKDSLDWFAATGTIWRMRFAVQTADRDHFFYFTPLTAFGLNSCGLSGGGAAQGGYQPVKGPLPL